MEKNDIKKIVRENYAKVASSNSCCCDSSSASYHGQTGIEKELSLKMGYSQKEMDNVPEGSNLGLGCGNPLAFAEIRKGDTVLDLGSGAGFDCFLAADKVGSGGKVIGVDMTVQMVEKARRNAKKDGYKNVEFRLGEIEDMPVEDSSVDYIISNCVVNLSPDKDKVFKEAYRALKPGGRIMVSDIVLTEELPDFIKNNTSAYVSCISGAIIKDEYLKIIKNVGFKDIKVLDEVNFPVSFTCNDNPVADMAAVEKSVLSIKVSAIKDGNA